MFKNWTLTLWGESNIEPEPKPTPEPEPEAPSLPTVTTTAMKYPTAIPTVISAIPIPITSIPTAAHTSADQSSGVGNSGSGGEIIIVLLIVSAFVGGIVFVAYKMGLFGRGAKDSKGEFEYLNMDYEDDDFDNLALEDIENPRKRTPHPET